MPNLAKYERHVNQLREKLGHPNRRARFMDCGHGLMLPIEREIIEPFAAHTEPRHVSVKHQSPYHMLAKFDWSDGEMLAGVREWVSPAPKLENV